MRVEQNMVDKRLEYSKARGNEKTQLGMGNILATIHMPVGQKHTAINKALKKKFSSGRSE